MLNFLHIRTVYMDFYKISCRYSIIDQTSKQRILTFCPGPGSSGDLKSVFCKLKVMPFAPNCVYSLFALNLRACFGVWSVNISIYLSKRDYGLANYSSDIVCTGDMFEWEEIT